MTVLPHNDCFRNGYTVIKEFCFPLKIKWHGLHLPESRGPYISILLISSREQIPKRRDLQTVCEFVAPSFMTSEASCGSVLQKKSSKTYMHSCICMYVSLMLFLDQKSSSGYFSMYNEVLDVHQIITTQQKKHFLAWIHWRNMKYNKSII